MQPCFSLCHPFSIWIGQHGGCIQGCTVMGFPSPTVSSLCLLSYLWKASFYAKPSSDFSLITVGEHQPAFPVFSCRQSSTFITSVTGTRRGLYSRKDSVYCTNISSTQQNPNVNTVWVFPQKEEPAWACASLDLGNVTWKALRGGAKGWTLMACAMQEFRDVLLWS